MKTCTHCKIEKLEGEFFKNKNKPDGLDGWCKCCKREYKKVYYEKNSENILLQGKIRRQDNKEKYSERIRTYREENKEAIAKRCAEYYKNHKSVLRILQKKYYEDNKDHIIEVQKRWYNKNKKRLYDERKDNPMFKLKRSMRNRMRNALLGRAKTEKTFELIGCSPTEFRSYIEKMFVDGMTWENYGKWHVDHIIPISSFDLNILEQRQKAFHYTNCQPLWAIDNLKKGVKL